MPTIKTFLSENWITLLVLLGILFAFVFLRTSPTELADAAAYDQLVSSGQPTIVEFYSNF